MIELYAITDDATPPNPPLRAVRSDGLTALYAPTEPHEATLEELKRHEAVVEALMESRDLLPVRFGTLLSDERAAARAVAERSEELSASLDRVRGAVELAVRAHPRRPAADQPARGGSGREYMSGRARQMETARAVHEPLVQLARDSVTRPGPELLRAAYLVDRGAVERFVAEVHRLQSKHPELDVLCTGPWPPYSFAERGDSA